MKTFVVSDLHLMDRNEDYLFNARKEVAFCELARTVLATESHLVLAGDIFDFTGLTPCRFGQKEFFAEAVPGVSIDLTLLEQVFKFRTTEELLRDIQSVFPAFFKALTSLAEAGRLTYIPGNHDCDFLKPRSREVLARVLGVSDQSIQWQQQVVVGTQLIVAHGNEYDLPNQTTRGCKNQGFIFTSALYNSVLPALKMLGVDPLVIAAIPAVRPEEATVNGLQYHLGDEVCKRLLLAFIRLLQRNGFFSGPASVPAWFLTHNAPLVSHLFRRGVTPKRVASLLPQEKTLIEAGRAGADLLRDSLSAKNPQLAQAIVILGHTHELDLQDKYINLGTWIDHITGLHPVEITATDVSLPVFLLDPITETAEVRNIKDLSADGDFFASPVLRASPLG